MPQWHKGPVPPQLSETDTLQGPPKAYKVRRRGTLPQHIRNRFLHKEVNLDKPPASRSRGFPTSGMVHYIHSQEADRVRQEASTTKDMASPEILDTSPTDPKSPTPKPEPAPVPSESPRRGRRRVREGVTPMDKAAGRGLVPARPTSTGESKTSSWEPPVDTEEALPTDQAPSAAMRHQIKKPSE